MSKKKKVVSIVLTMVSMAVALSGVRANSDQKVIPTSETNQVRYFGVPSDYSGSESLVSYKEKKMKEHRKALGLIHSYIKEHNITDITIDLDDKSFQNLVFRLGVNVDEFSLTDRQCIIEFVKFVDLYEAINRNKEIKKFEDKIKSNGTLPPEEKQHIELMLPANPISTPRLETITTDAVSFNSTAAVNYAYQYWNTYNPTYPDYSQNGEGGDCTNFVSQVIKAGGITTYLNGNWDSGWWYTSKTKHSFAWASAQGFHNVLGFRKAGISVNPNLLVTNNGQPVSADFTNNGSIDHFAVQTKAVGYTGYVTYHTTNTKDKSLQVWKDADYTIRTYNLYPMTQ